jgi:hypothetical protein
VWVIKNTEIKCLTTEEKAVNCTVRILKMKGTYNILKLTDKVTTVFEVGQGSTASTKS